MKLRDLNAEAIELLTFQITSEAKPIGKEIIQLYSLGDSFAAFSQTETNGHATSPQSYYLDLKDKRQKEDLNLELNRNNCNLGEVISVTDEEVTIKVYFFVGSMIELDEIEVAISDEFQEQAIKSKYIRKYEKNTLNSIICLR